MKKYFFLIILFLPARLLADSILVTSLADLQLAINNAKPGDIIQLKNGVYTTTEDIVINKAGTKQQPIIISAQQPGAVEITGSGGFNLQSPAAYVIITGFNFTHAASKARTGNGTSFCQWTRNVFETPGTGDYLTIAGNDHIVDYNTFRNKDSLGKFIAIRGTGSQIAERLWIHHNYFKTQKNMHDRNGAEAFQFGLSGFSLSSSNSIVEWNLFEDCNGEIELISVKASRVTVRYNTIRNCPAQLTLRHGNFNQVYGNYFFNTPGLRIFGDDHLIYSNHFENCPIAIQIGNGGAEVADGAPLTSHDRPDRVTIVSNTLINNKANIIQTARDKGLGSTNITIGNNIVQGGGPAASIVGPAVNYTWSGNIIFNTQGAGNMPAGSYREMDPKLKREAVGNNLPAGINAEEIAKATATAKILYPADVGQSSNRDERMAWWREARFGMFIHWGVYAVPAGIYNGQRINRIGEWIMNRGKIPVDAYKKFAGDFNPIKYDPDAWVRMAKDAGMKYIVITSKHHDGFALFDSKATTWDMMDATPYKKDLLKPLAEACRRHGLKLGFYYSQAQDWVHPGGAAARRPASEGWANPDSAKIDAYTQEHGGHWDPAQTSKTMAQYIDEIAVPQVKEILSNYGDVAVLWWDTPTDMTDDFAQKLDALLKLQPNIITNDRLKRPNFPGDFKTPEQRIPNLGELDGKDWETCMTMNETWGYKSWAHDWKSKETLIRNLIDIASKGGNFLLNVGPKADGTIPQESVDLLKQIGQWMKVNGEAIYDTKASPFGLFTWGRCTRKESTGKTTLYLSVFEWPKDGKLSIPALKNSIISAKLLATGKAVKATVTNEGAVFNVPEKPIDTVATVIKVEIKGNVQD